MDIETIYYFAYGSNMNDARMVDRGITVISKQLGVLNGYTFIINKKSKADPNIGFANIIPADNYVEGVIFEILSTDIQKLDKFEGYPKHYIRETLSINTDNGCIDAITYIANVDWVSTDPLLTTAEYQNHILEGAKYLNAQYADFLKNTIKLK